MKFIVRFFIVFVLSFFPNINFASQQINYHNFKLHILHINDDHSYVKPEKYFLYFNNKKTEVSIGGLSEVASEIQKLRDSNTLVVHAGDDFVGTAYFLAFNGVLTQKILNVIGLDVFTPGNHEFDKGEKFLADFLSGLKASIVVANVKAKDGSPLSSIPIRPYVIKKINGEKFGIIGITTSRGINKEINNTIIIEDEIICLNNTIKILKNKGINKIIVVSHLGYEVDKIIAKHIDGVNSTHKRNF